MLDVGTKNEALLRDPLYIGLQQHARSRGADYDALVDEFVEATQEVFPGVVFQFEDFANHNAFRLLRQIPRPHLAPSTTTSRAPPPSRWRASSRRCASPAATLADQTFLCLGAGEAATGISDLLVSRDESPRACRSTRPGSRCWLVDSQAASS